MDGGGPKPQLCARLGTWSNVNAIIEGVRSIPRAPPPNGSSMAGRFSGAGGRLPIRHGVGGFATKFIHSRRVTQKLARCTRSHDRWTLHRGAPVGQGPTGILVGWPLPLYLCIGFWCGRALATGTAWWAGLCLIHHHKARSHDLPRADTPGRGFLSRGHGHLLYKKSRGSSSR